MAVITFNYESFIALFPDFSAVPEGTLQMYWDIAINYISDETCWNYMKLSQQTLALNLMTAHVAYINTQINTNQTPFIANNVSVDKVSIGILPPPVRNQWRFWLNTSPYGTQCIALLENAIVGGVYIGAPGCW